MGTHGLLDGLRADTAQMVEAVVSLASIESPSADTGATAACAAAVTDLGRSLLGHEPDSIVVDGRTHLSWRFGPRARVLLLGHIDTVWPIGTLDRWPVSVVGDTITGPGVFDMKAGVVQGLFALNHLDSCDGVEVLLTSDEEIGSGSSRDLIEDAARRVEAVLVLEPSAAGALKTSRKGTLSYRVQIAGRAAHAGLEPERGANALIEAAHVVLALEAMARPELGTTITPTMATSGSAANTVPAMATLTIDARVLTLDEQARIDSELSLIETTVPGTTITVERIHGRPPLPEAASARLYRLADRLAADLGLGPLTQVAVGGGSDGNFTAALGIDTLDGLGPVGDHAHGEGEYALIPAMAERAALVARLIEELR